MSEKNPTTSYERTAGGSTEQQRANHEQRERLRDNVERTVEQGRVERGVEESVALRNAEKLAESTETQHEAAETPASKPEQRSTAPSSKQQRAQAYNTIMADTRSHMTPAGRSFSKVIHNPAVESASNVVGATVARPNAILTGSFTAFIVVLGVFLVARHYGYPLSGSESIVAFAGGWVLGIVFDYLRTMITGRN